MENVFGSLQVYGEAWQVTSRRKFNSDEIAAIRKNEVVPSQFGKSVCFFLVSGGSTFIPMSNHGKQPEAGESIDMTKCELLTLERSGDDPIVRVEIGE